MADMYENILPPQQQKTRIMQGKSMDYLMNAIGPDKNPLWEE